MRNSDSAAAWIRSGLAAHQSGDVGTAESAYRQALGFVPDHPGALHLLGTALLQQERANDALPPLEAAARRLRNDPDVIGALAQAYFALGRYPDARETFRKASRLDPRRLQFQLGIANAHALAGELTQALPLLERIVQRFPQDPLARFNYGNVLRDLERTEAACAEFARTVELAPQWAEARNNLAGALHKLQRFAEAEEQFRHCIAQAPDYLLARCNLASVLIDLGRFAEAESECRAILALDPDMAVAHTYLGAALGHQGRLLEALDQHAAAARIHDAQQTLEAYAGALADVGRHAESARSFARALARDPESLPAHQVFGTAQLGRGCMASGWAHYGTRPSRRAILDQRPELSATRELPPELQGRRIGLVKEQGLGDELFFLRWAPVLKASGATVAYQASGKIASLLARSSALDIVVEDHGALPPCDDVLLVGDLPHALGAAPASPSNLPAERYDACMRGFAERMAIYRPGLPPAFALAPLPERLAELSARLQTLGPPPYLGVTWRAGTLPEKQHGESWVLYKECGIERFAQALQGCAGTMIALQRKPGPGELESFAAALGRPVHDLTAYNEDLEGMLALLALIDEYVGVSNTNMHLRAGVGKMARVLVPAPPEWRWMSEGRSAWFPSFPVYRQTLQGDWGPALDALAADLHTAARS